MLVSRSLMALSMQNLNRRHQADAETSTLARHNRQPDAQTPAFARQPAFRHGTLMSRVKFIEYGCGKRARFARFGDNLGTVLPATKKQSAPVVVRVGYTSNIDG